MISIGNLQINKLCLGDVEVTKAYLGDVEVYSSAPEPKYMTITVDSSNTGSTVISPKVSGSLPNLNLQYRINNGNWKDFIVGTTADISVRSGYVVQFKGNNPDGLSVDYSNYIEFSISKPVHISGNIMSLIDGVGATLEIPRNYCFYYLFKNSKIKTVSPDFLPATTLKNGCYYYMFYGCSLLTQAPELPATTLANYCYNSMFIGCTSLTTAPVLPATTLSVECYQYMFSGCTSLTQAPELPATKLAEGCYNEMFNECTSLTKAPELPASVLVKNCYYNMFSKCSSLSYVKSFAVSIGADGATTNWLYQVNRYGKLLGKTTYRQNSADGVPIGWTFEYF